MDLGIDWNVLLHDAVVTTIRNAPGIATAVIIIWRMFVRRVDDVKDAVTDMQGMLDGRISELKDGLMAKGQLEGYLKAITLAREDRAEYVKALLTDPHTGKVSPLPGEASSDDATKKD